MTEVRQVPGLTDALQMCVASLSRLASYRFDDFLQHRLRDLGERKEELASAEHEELLALVQFAEARTREKLVAELAPIQSRGASTRLARCSFAR